MDEAKRIIKNTINCFGSSLNVPITKNLIATVKLAKLKYDDDDSKSTTQNVPDCSNEIQEEEDSKIKELDGLNWKIKQISHGLEVADDIIQKSNDDIKIYTSQEKSKKQKQ